MTVSAIIGALRDQQERRPAQVLAHLNRVLHGQITGFATCTTALISADGAMAIANAGNLAPYRNGEELAVESGLPLGISPKATTPKPPTNSIRKIVSPSSPMESSKPPTKNASSFGFDRTQAISNQHANAIAAAAKQFGQKDDISVLSITRTAAIEPVLA